VVCFWTPAKCIQAFDVIEMAALERRGGSTRAGFFLNPGFATIPYSWKPKLVPLQLAALLESDAHRSGEATE
jgi:hypothetical protein